MDCEILNSEAAVAAIAPEWDQLQQRAGHDIFTAHAWTEGWWRHLGQPGGHRLHVVAGRRDGRLVAVAPLSVSQRMGIRLLQWAGTEVFDYSDFLLEDPADAAPLWDAIRKSPHYDLARIQEVRPEAVCLPALEAFACQSRLSHARSIRIEWPTGEAWLASLPYAARKHYRSRLKRAQERGAVRHEAVRSGPLPEAAFAALIAQKTDWSRTHGKKGVFESPGAAAFFRHVAEAEDRLGNLYFSTLYCGDAIIAVHLGFVIRDSFYSYMPSYSAEWAAVSPGELMRFKCISWAISNGLKEFDFLRGEERYKASLANHSRTLKDFVFARTLRGRLAKLVYLRRACSAAPAQAAGE